MQKWIDLGLDYETACHGMQSGVAFEMSHRSRQSATEPKHLRVGVNAAMSDHGGLVYLLIEKGLITEDEYREAIRKSMNQEVFVYETRAAELGGFKVSFR